MPIKLAGKLASRGNRAAGDNCPIDRTMKVIGSRSTMLLMREAYYGTTRFDAFAARTGITEAVTSKHLRDLVAAGLLTREPYQEPGQRTRHEYVLTESGRDLMPAVFALGQWGRKHLPREGSPWMTHDGCDASVTVGLHCANGHDVDADALVISN